MTAKIIDGKAIAAEIRAEVAQGVEELKNSKGITPGLAVVLVGEDPASQVYVRGKEKACQEMGIYSEKHVLEADVSEDKLLELIDALNQNPKIHGILVQLPLPDHISEEKVIHAILPSKDVDGFHPENVGKLAFGADTFLPCTPHGVLVLLERSGVDLKGKEVVVVGRSNIVGKPVALMLLKRHATVTICHTRTKDLAFHTKRADILIAAAGKAEMIKGDMVKEGSVIIDVGVNQVGVDPATGKRKLVGDVEFAAAAEKAAAITPVPGGVGPMTITMLLQNTLKAAQQVG